MARSAGGVVVGSGPNKVLALHGWFGHAHAWGPLVEWLDTDRFSYAFMDYRGYGARMGIAGQFTMDEIAADALTLATALGWERFAVVGHSMGGMAALRVAVEAPERVLKVLGINAVPPSGYPFNDEGWGFFSQAAGSEEVRRQILDLTTGRRLTPTFIRWLAAGSLAHSTPEAFAAYLTAWGRTDFAARAAALTQPVHQLVGEHDPAVGEALVRGSTLRTLPHGTVETLANAGHYPMFEVPVALATAMERFLGG